MENKKVEFNTLEGALEFLDNERKEISAKLETYQSHVGELLKQVITHASANQPTDGQ